MIIILKFSHRFKLVYLYNFRISQVLNRFHFLHVTWKVIIILTRFRGINKKRSVLVVIKLLEYLLRAFCYWLICLYVVSCSFGCIYKGKYQRAAIRFTVSMLTGHIIWTTGMKRLYKGYFYYSNYLVACVAYIGEDQQFDYYIKVNVGCKRP